MLAARTFVKEDTMKRLALGILALTLVAGCGGPPPVQRIDPNETIDLSGRWNDTDSRFAT